jgi:hypothetical protein
VETDASGTTAEVEHPPADEPHRAALPATTTSGNGARYQPGSPVKHTPIVALDDLDHMTSGEEIAQQMTEGTFSGPERRAQHREGA